MAVQQNRKTRAKRDARRGHDKIAKPTVSIDGTTGESHLRHHVTSTGYYRGRRVLHMDDE